MKSSTVSIIVDPNWGVRLRNIAEDGPVWIAATSVNRAAATKIWHERPTSSGDDGVTTFDVDSERSPTEWCLEVLPTFDEHFGAYDDNPPSYTSIEIYGAPATPELIAMLAANGYVHVVARADGFRASRVVGEQPG